VNIQSIAFLRRTGGRLLTGLAVGISLALAASSAGATDIQKVVSPGGIEAWLVHDSTVPLIAVNMAFRGGSNQDPEDKPGVAALAAGLWDEGAGDIDSNTFHGLLERKAIEMNFRASRDYVRGTLRMLSANRDDAFEYLRLALTAPRFDAEPIERVRAQIVAQLQRQATNPNDIGSRQWWKTAFPDHPYGQPVDGTLESIPQITVDDVKAFTRRVVAREAMKIAVVGDIDADTLGRLLDRTFGALPAKADLRPVASAKPQGIGRRIVVQLDVPQAVVTFGGLGIARNDPDFMAAYIVNDILGGGSSSSRLYREVREKRGLAYGVYDSLIWLNHASVILGGTATRAEATAETIDVVEREIRRLAEEGPTEREVTAAKSYLKGSYVLGLDTSAKIAGQLVQIQLDNLGIDYIDRRGAIIDAVTLADIKRVAKRLLDPGLLITVVGRPVGVSSTAQGG
jgi:zinc protease